MIAKSVLYAFMYVCVCFVYVCIFVYVCVCVCVCVHAGPRDHMSAHNWGQSETQTKNRQINEKTDRSTSGERELTCCCRPSWGKASYT
jgi:hypothetical protein